MSKTAKVFDMVTGEVSTIPLAELAHGMKYVLVEGVGEVWVEPKQFAECVDPSYKAPFQHAPLSKELRDTIKEQIMEPLSEVRPMALSKWEDGFRRGLKAENEIALWLLIAKRYKAFVDANALSKAQRTEVFDVMLHCSMVPNREAFWETVRRQHLTREQVEAAIAPFELNWRGRQKLKEKLKHRFGEHFDELSREVAKAKVIVANGPGHEVRYKLLFGRSEIERLDRSGGRTVEGALNVTFRNHSELHWLRQLIKTVKGFTDE
jgi:hypothetical protein